MKYSGDNMDKISERSGLFFATFKKLYSEYSSNCTEWFQFKYSEFRNSLGLSKMIAYAILLGICGTNIFLLSQ